MSQQTTYKLTHVNRKGVDFVFVPLDAAFGRMTPQEQSTALKSLHSAANSAGLKGSVVLVWDKGGGQSGILAEKQLHPHLGGITVSYVTSNINRQLTVQGLAVTPPPWVVGASATVVKSNKGGIVSVTADIEEGEVFLDGTSVGNIPAKFKIPEGTHVVEVRKPGYHDFRKEVQITDGSEVNLRPVLQKDDTILMSLPEKGNFQGVIDSKNKVKEFQRRHRVGLMTMLFTDIVGSTKLKQDLGDREAIKMIQWHHGVVRSTLLKFPSAEEISTSGDSFFIVFAKPSDAVKFSLMLQSKLREYARETGRKVYDRIGIHVGEVFVEEVEGSKLNDCYGIQVDTSARVQSLGEGDQILMTRFAFDNAKQVIKGTQIEGIGELAWINHGMYVLKGVEEPLEICEVGESGMAALRPPPDSEKVHRFNPNETEGPKATPGTGHVVVSTRPAFSSSGMKPLTIRKQG